MSSTDLRYPAASGRDSPPIVTPHYGSSLPNPPTDLEGARNTRCVTGLGFIRSLHGILNIITIVALVCVLISAGVVSRDETRLADQSGYYSNVKLSAYNTRNAVLAFAVIALILILVDTILHMTALINRLPAIFDVIFIVVMLVLAGILLIVGCCAAAWEKKMKDKLQGVFAYQHRGAAGSAAFFTFAAMIAIVVNFVSRLLRSKNRAPT